MQIITKTFNEETINLNKFQIIPITSEMKSKYPALKKYKELIVSGEEIHWEDADRYAKKNRAVLPNINEGKDIVKLIKNSGWNKYFWLWTREEYSAIHNTHSGVDFYGVDTYGDKSSYGNCFCLR